MGHFWVSATIPDRVLATNPKQACWKREINVSFWGMHCVDCLCHSLFWPFLGRPRIDMYIKYVFGQQKCQIHQNWNIFWAIRSLIRRRFRPDMDVCLHQIVPDRVRRSYRLWNQGHIGEKSRGQNEVIEQTWAWNKLYEIINRFGDLSKRSESVSEWSRVKLIRQKSDIFKIKSYFCPVGDHVHGKPGFQNRYFRSVTKVRPQNGLSSYRGRSKSMDSWPKCKLGNIFMGECTKHMSNVYQNVIFIRK